VCTYQGLRLKPIGALDFGATRAEAYVSESEQQPVLVAMNTETPTAGARHEELRLFALVDDGGLQALDVKDLLKPSRQILFHPSGRALYVIDSVGALHVFTISMHGELDLAMSIDHAGESMAITHH
jgi:hypothetical protein